MLVGKLSDLSAKYAAQEKEKTAHPTRAMTQHFEDQITAFLAAETVQLEMDAVHGGVLDSVEQDKAMLLAQAVDVASDA